MYVGGGRQRFAPSHLLSTATPSGVTWQLHLLICTRFNQPSREGTTAAEARTTESGQLREREKKDTSEEVPDYRMTSVRIFSYVCLLVVIYACVEVTYAQEEEEVEAPEEGKYYKNLANYLRLLTRQRYGKRSAPDYGSRTLYRRPPPYPQDIVHTLDMDGDGKISPYELSRIL
ncbi:Hypp6348 [Branchiostoma lanceolatum]|uniref:Hypp6348 protein n=1 Tax=Branchiostoma lanceolatum TaxID=7740 RepID=A0A8J9YTB3_BRALA|nr:Hypp6348 [Branchiostoma lanceolatum]